MESARHARGAGNPPRSLVALAAVALAAGTGAALWLLPGASGAGWTASAHLPSGRPPSALPSSAETLLAARQASSVGTSPAPSPSGIALPRPPAGPAVAASAGPAFRQFLDLARTPGAAHRVHPGGSYLVGHVIAGPDGCTPRWSGPVTGAVTRLARMRLAGGDLRPAFGGPDGPEPSVTCVSEARLAAAYRTAIEALRAGGIDFEVRGSAGRAATLRRAAAVVRLQRAARDRGRPLALTFTVPATPDGLAPGDLEMLRTTRAAGADIEAVELLVALTPGAGSPGNLHRLALAVRAARPQIGEALGVAGPDVWRRMALTPVLSAAGDLGPEEAGRLAAFRARTGLGWLSLRGADPAPGVVEALTPI
ncbi:hypothetical protein [Microbispora corallina]|uniref:hypothetical protein n=1 Tax=Microbispora corallina TaxID=83302 RepID=UPI001952642C|nr:hypothetical protein [Microbispora corallina]